MAHSGMNGGLRIILDEPWESDDEELSRLKRELDLLLKRSADKIDNVTTKALKLRQSVRQRPSTVKAMRAVLSEPPEKKDG